MAIDIGASGDHHPIRPTYHSFIRSVTESPREPRTTSCDLCTESISSIGILRESAYGSSDDRAMSWCYLFLQATTVSPLRIPARASDLSKTLADPLPRLDPFSSWCWKKYSLHRDHASFFHSIMDPALHHGYPSTFRKQPETLCQLPRIQWTYFRIASPHSW